MDAVFHLVASSGKNGSQVLASRLAGSLRVVFTALACESVARCLRGSRTALAASLLSVPSRLKTLVHHV